ncbi:hypothetical protein QFC21_005329 [Naganishia friedmannii]|uniref:Uncharacterized protein n=1 Tax=Naganishia friedmannii TaxID=89922 RepID=A0ACC2VAH0_9TREE|nr:hypothetical protein QFC21_005329 [Naganishia friedmannii]
MKPNQTSQDTPIHTSSTLRKAQRGYKFIIFGSHPPSASSSTTNLAECTITDLKHVAKRRFAFVGYVDEEQARRVKEWFDGTYLGSSKIKVEYVRDEAIKPSHTQEKRPLQQPEVVPPATAAAAEEESQKDAPSQKDKRLQEFMDVMKNKDTTDPSQLVPSASTTTNAEAEARNSESGVAGIVDVAGEGGKQEDDEEVDDAEWLRRRQAQAAGKVADTVQPTSAGEAVQVSTSKSTTTAPALSEEQQILSTSRLFIRNLSFLTTPSALSQQFSQFGELEEVHLPLSSTTKQPIGTAFVQYKRGEDAVSAWKGMDGRTYMGRLVHILPGRPKFGQQQLAQQGEEGQAVISGRVIGKDTERNVKADIDKKRKDASGKGLNWATLYMNSDAVAASVAARMGISKADILNPDSTLRSSDENEKLSHVGSAVKLALAETSVIAETKKYFEEHGVVLDRLTETSDALAEGGARPKRTPRSKTTLLIKNIPFGTDVQLLTGLFEPHGTIKRLLMPPTGTLAVVEFEEEDAAASAFRAVNYRRLGSAVVYLEKAPEGLIDADAAVPDEPAARERVEPLSEADVIRQKVEAAEITDDVQADAAGEAGSTLFVKNLAWATTTERLQQVFSALPAFSFARVSTKPDPKNPAGARLSMGFGFLGFTSKEAALKAMNGLKGYKLDGHDLEFKFAMRDGEGEGRESKADAVAGKQAKSKTTKMIVKNVPFEASKNDIRDLFSAFGTLKSCRLPKKHNSTGRGFAFLDFTTRHEAEAAMNALKHTHLLGRHLVLEWSEGDDLAAKEVEKLRQKTKSQFVADGETGGPSKKRKLDLRKDTDPDNVDM